MPRGDGTGPLGQGPMTGRGQGFCVLTSSEENLGQVKGFAGVMSTGIASGVEGSIFGSFKSCSRVSTFKSSIMSAGIYVAVAPSFSRFLTMVFPAFCGMLLPRVIGVFLMRSAIFSFDAFLKHRER